MATIRTLTLISALIAGCASAPPIEGTPATHSNAAEQRTASIYDARLSGVGYPYDVDMIEFEAQGQKLEMAYMDINPTTPNGLTVLLLHGKNFSGAYWQTTIEALSARGFRVVVPDQIGFGKSSKPTHYQYSFHALAAQTRALLTHLGVENVAVVGHSMGGMLAARFALMYPEQTRQLVLVNPIGLEDWKTVVPYQTIDQWYQGELNKTPEKVREYMKASYFDGNWAPEYDDLAAIQMGWSEGPDLDTTAWASALTYDMIFTQPVVYEFKNVQAKTLLIIGQRDKTALGKNLVSPETAKTLGDYAQLGKATQAAIPNSRLVELEGVGHVPQYEAWPNYIEALQTFLEEDLKAPN